MNPTCLSVCRNLHKWNNLKPNFRFDVLTTASSISSITNSIFYLEWTVWIHLWNPSLCPICMVANEAVLMHGKACWQLCWKHPIQTEAPAFFPQHATFSTSILWRWNLWQALKLLLRPFLRHWLLRRHLLPPLCTLRCHRRASHSQTTRGSKCKVCLYYMGGLQDVLWE